MPLPSQPAGPLEAAVRAHFPSEAVLNEARALDRELARPEPAWDNLLSALQAFVGHYASVLLHEPDAIEALGSGCLGAVQRAPAVSQRALAASLLVHLLAAVAAEVKREGIDRVGARVPAQLGELLRGLADQDSLPFDRGRLVPPMLEFGQQLVMMADEGDPPSLWYELLAELNRLLLAITRRRISGEPAYDGRWDGQAMRSQLAVSGLDPVRCERIAADLDWLIDLERGIADGLRNSAEVFLELSAYENRDEREQAWRTWFEQVAAQVAGGRVDPHNLRLLCEGLADWIATVEDRSFLAALANILARHVPTVLVHAGEPALSIALKTFGQAIAGRLGREAGRGECDPALEDLRRVGAELVERALGAAQPSVQEALELGARLRTGPVTGQALSCEDAIWRLALTEGLEPADARRWLSGLIVGFHLEQFRLGRWHPEAPGGSLAVDQSRQLLAAASRALAHPWAAGVELLVRAVLRAAPISPLQTAGSTCRAKLLALAPGGRKTSYLDDLRVRMLDQTGSASLGDVERVLCFWVDGQAEHLDGLASPDSLAALSASAKRDGQIRRLLNRLADHAPVQDKSGIAWLARLPDPFYDPTNLAKVAGFEGLDPEATETLANLLCIQRALTERSAPAGGERLVDLDEPALLERVDVCLAERSRLVAGLFGHDELDETDAFALLERFEQDLGLIHRLDALLEDLSQRCLARSGHGDPGGCAAVLGRMLVHAALSGFAPDETEGLARQLLADPGAGWPVERIRRVQDRWHRWRADLVRDLRPQVIDSLRRLRENPLARPVASYQHWTAANRARPEDQAVSELVELLVDDLLVADGGLGLLGDFLRRLDSNA